MNTFKLFTKVHRKSMMKDWGAIFQHKPDACTVEAENITSGTLARLSKVKKYKRFFAFLITLVMWLTH